MAASCSCVSLSSQDLASGLAGWACQFQAQGCKQREGRRGAWQDVNRFYEAHKRLEGEKDKSLVTNWDNLFWASNVLLATTTDAGAFHLATQVPTPPSLPTTCVDALLLSLSFPFLFHVLPTHHPRSPSRGFLWDSRPAFSRGRGPLMQSVLPQLSSLISKLLHVTADVPLVWACLFVACALACLLCVRLFVCWACACAFVVCALMCFVVCALACLLCVLLFVCCVC